MIYTVYSVRGLRIGTVQSNSNEEALKSAVTDRGRVDQENARALTALNNQLKIVNLAMCRQLWREAVKTVCGQDAYEQVCEYIAKTDPRA